MTAVVNVDVVSDISRITVVDQLARVSVPTVVLAVADALKRNYDALQRIVGVAWRDFLQVFILTHNKPAP